MKNKDLEAIINHYGRYNQMLKAVEEMSELIKEIIKDFTGEKSNVIEEFADVWVMLNQLMIIYNFNESEIAELANQKVSRTLIRIEESKAVLNSF